MNFEFRNFSVLHADQTLIRDFRTQVNHLGWPPNGREFQFAWLLFYARNATCSQCELHILRLSRCQTRACQIRQFRNLMPAFSGACGRNANTVRMPNKRLKSTNFVVRTPVCHTVCGFHTGEHAGKEGLMEEKVQWRATSKLNRFQTFQLEIFGHQFLIQSHSKILDQN